MIKRISPKKLLRLLILVTIFNTFWVNGVEEDSQFYEDSSEESSKTQPSEPASPIVGQLGNSSPEIEKSTDDLDFESAVTSGVAPDLSEINQNSTSNSEVTSSPGCPEPYKQRHWVLYGSPPRCYLTGYEWPCPKNMILRPQSNSFYGYCDCHCTTYSSDYFGGSTSSPKSYCLGKTKDGQVRVLSYSRGDGQCHPLFEQGGCAEGEWFVFGDNPLLGPFCEKRRCPSAANEDNTFSFYDYKTNSCQKAGDACQRSNIKWPETFQSTSNDWIPICMPPVAMVLTSTFYISNQKDCPTGQVFSRLFENCVPQRIRRGGGIG